MYLAFDPWATHCAAERTNPLPASWKMAERRSEALVHAPDASRGRLCDIDGAWPQPDGLDRLGGSHRLLAVPSAVADRP